ncbi:TetR/AcrR family transcriptional regulator [Streptomyces sp. SID8352]|uniref:TetR/AcrR family transcriptional regulator n=1 Tax=Streptomyces sp. SID8352 TaxID=2690338 RepID=UPI00136CB22F|nr:TetR/AcrR family transcriptional regulator [Streptomyces sp. SID8352]MYU25001.1 TetR family transcriptional regulator [Streptomyces sp. SID8352]
MTERRVDGRIERGNQTRRLVLRHTVGVASREGLEALSLGRLAAELKLSKSGVFALFGSKEGLQLATVRAASRIHVTSVVQPALAQPPGLRRVRELSEAWLRYSRERVFPGGCFFQKVVPEYSSRPGPVRDAIRSADGSWRAFVRQTVSEAQELGELGTRTPADQMAFELTALWEAANARSLLTESDLPYAHARTAVRSLLADAAAVDSGFLGDLAEQPVGT